MKAVSSNGAFSGANVPNVKYTRQLMIELHEGQTDHSGKPYAFHPSRVAANVKRLDPRASDDVVMAALLHDTIEDCGIDDEFLRLKGYSEECIEMIKLVTKPEGDERDYEQVIDELIASGNRGAMLVKLADNMDNLHPERSHDLMQSDPEKAERLANRYRASIEKLSAAIGLNSDSVFELIANAPQLEGADAVPR